MTFVKENTTSVTDVTKETSNITKKWRMTLKNDIRYGTYN